MEGIIILILLAILAVPVILLVWVKTSTGSLIREVINKVNYLTAKVDNLDKEKKKKPKPIVEEDPVTVNEN